MMVEAGAVKFQGDVLMQSHVSAYEVKQLCVFIEEILLRKLARR